MKEVFAQVEKTKSRLLGSKGFSVQLKYPGGVILTEGKASSVRYIWAKNAEPAVGLRITWKPFTNTVCRDVFLSCLRIAGIVWVCVVLLKHSNFNDESSNIPHSQLWSLSLKSRALSFVWFPVFFLLHFQVVVSHRFLFLVSVLCYVSRSGLVSVFCLVSLCVKLLIIPLCFFVIAVFSFLSTLSVFSLRLFYM